MNDEPKTAPEIACSRGRAGDRLADAWLAFEDACVDANLEGRVVTFVPGLGRAVEVRTATPGNGDVTWAVSDSFAEGGHATREDHVRSVATALLSAATKISRDHPCRP